MHREQPALDEVGLRRAAQADRDVGLAHGEVELLVGQDELDAHVGIEVEELADALREPDRAEPDGRRHLEVAGRPLARLDEARPGGLEAHAHVAGGAEQEVALLGQDQPAGVAVEQRRLELALEGADLPAHRRLAEAEIVAGAGEAAGFRDGVEDPESCPSPRRALAPRRRGRYSAASTGHVLERQGTAPLPSAAIQPNPAAVTAWR